MITFANSLSGAWKHAPCNGCDQQQACAEQLLACTGFRYWIASGSRQKARVRVPTREIYDRVFKVD